MNTSLYARLARKAPVVPDTPAAMLHTATGRWAILASLTEPPQTVEIARAVERTVPNVTGHLRAMLRLPPEEQRSFCRPSSPLS